MKSNWGVSFLIILLGWFWGLTVPDPQYPGVLISIIVGPYKTSFECEHHKEQVSRKLVASLEGLEVTPCFRRPEA